MQSEILVAFRLVRDQVLRLTEGISSDEACTQPNGLPNHAVWTLGHLCHSFQAMGGEIGLEPWLPETWADNFGTGTQPTACAKQYPSVTELRAHFRAASQRLEDRILRMSAETMSEPLPDENYRAALPTIGHALVHILIGHASVHAGQLSTWRRLVGLSRKPEALDVPGEA